ncbi:hypothetical protein AZE42_04954 [Rhizopogon vesiculosus]|uniref:Uncharacterized protein n=1 Tax=Rhizopogon vesiculosus TaxID=180088 RepID=A0A1J8QLD1_9AGAM|nr:hypothetical protein AZE42_04954 [Rhizopogon vesiculosus]
MQDSTSDAYSAGMANCHYLRLIFTLQKNDEWCKRLARGGHFQWCISSSLYDTVLASPNCLGFDKTYLAGILLCIDPSSNDIPPDPDQEKWRALIQRAWDTYWYFPPSKLEQVQLIETLQTLVTTTRQILPDPYNLAASAKLAKLARYVHGALEDLKRDQTYLRRADAGLDGVVLTMQGLCDDLPSYAASEHEHIPQGDNELPES